MNLADSYLEWLSTLSVYATNQDLLAPIVDDRMARAKRLLAWLDSRTPRHGPTVEQFLLVSRKAIRKKQEEDLGYLEDLKRLSVEQLFNLPSGLNCLLLNADSREFIEGYRESGLQTDIRRLNKKLRNPARSVTEVIAEEVAWLKAERPLQFASQYNDYEVIWAQLPEHGLIVEVCKDLNHIDYLDYLTKRLADETETARLPIKGLTWLGNKTEAVELVKSLLLVKAVKGETSTDKEVYELFSAFLGISLDDASKKLVKIKGKNVGSETAFLDKMKSAFMDYLATEK